MTDTLDVPALWPAGGNDMARVIREFHWAATPLGPAETWPSTLRDAIDLMLGLGFPATLQWGRESVFFYNDAYLPYVWAKHPTALGRPLLDSFPEILPVYQPIFDRVWKGETVVLHDQPFDHLRADGRAAWFDLSHSPIHDEAGNTAGILVAGFETTAGVLAEKQRAELETERARQEEQRAQAEAALRESETRSRGLVETLAQAIWESDAEGLIVKDSPSWRTYTGQTLEEWMGYGWLSAVHPEDRERAGREWRAAVQARHSVNIEFRLRHAASGPHAYRWTSIFATPLIGHEGEVQKWIGMNMDIDDRKRAEQALRESEERQAFLLQLSDALRRLSGPVEIQAEACRLLGEHLQANRVFYAEFEESEAVIHRDYANGVSSLAGRTPVSAWIKQILSSYSRGESLAVNDVAADPRLGEADRQTILAIQCAAFIGVGLVKKDRLRACFSVHSREPRGWKDQEVELVRDTAERTWAALDHARMEAALRESEERFRLLVENVREYALVQTDFEGMVTSWNPGAERLFGYTSAEILGHPFVILLPPENRHEGIIAREMAALSHGERNQDAHMVQRKDGSRFWAEWVTEPVRDDAGRLRGTAKVMHDETEREQAQKFMRDSLAEKEELLKEVHHRVKNNLQVITSLLNLQTGTVEDQRVLTLFEETRNRVQSIASIHELLYQSVSFTSIQLCPYASQLVADLVQFYGMQNRIRASVSGNGATIELERAVPYGLLLNELVSNALKHGFPDERRGEVRVDLKRVGNEIVLRVSDTGVGLPPHFSAQQSSSLGLKLIRVLARQLRGSVAVIPGAGATFEARFPAKDSREGSEP